MKKFTSAGLLFIFLLSCKTKPLEGEEEGTAEEIRTPVTITAIDTTELIDYLELNAISSFQQSNFIKAPANGYVTAVNIKPGQMVHAGQLCFTMQTKEAHALGNTVNKIDSSFHFSGLINIRAAATGYIQALDRQRGDYVMDGEQLAVLADSKSFGFMLNLPVEFRKYVNPGKTVKVDLPDGIRLNGVIASIMPNVDSISQTQNVLVKVASATAIPEKLIAKVRIIKEQQLNAVSLPKAAVLADEAQTNFWIMKMIDSVTAAKVYVKKGMETKDRVQILSPRLSASDKILLTGNYGLPDTAKVKIVKE